MVMQLREFLLRLYHHLQADILSTIHLHLLVRHSVGLHRHLHLLVPHQIEILYSLDLALASPVQSRFQAQGNLVRLHHYHYSLLQ